LYYFDFEAFFPVDDEIWLCEPTDYCRPREIEQALISGIP
jgi:hypothetical protein